VLDHLQVADPAAAGRTLDPAGRTDGQVAPGDGGDVDFAGTAALQAQPLGVPLGELAGLGQPPLRRGRWCGSVPGRPLAGSTAPGADGATGDAVAGTVGFGAVA
jgi:hypothetical protein